MNIQSILLPNEQILYRGIAVPKKGIKNILGIILIIVWCFIPFIALSQVNQINRNTIILIAVLLLIVGFVIYAIIYNFILKKRKIIGQEYFITNQRAIIYSSSKNEFKIGYLDRFDDFRVDNEKNNFGDVYMGIVAEQSNNTKEDLTLISNTLLNPDKNNMNFICFESVENPYQVMEIARNQRINLVSDRPILNSTEEVKIGDQKVIIYNQPVWVWLLYSVIVIILFAIPVVDIINSLKVWNNYTKTSSVITNIETKNVGGDEKRQDVKYFVNVSYEINNNKYESVITNDTCYLKSTQNFKRYPLCGQKYDSYFRNMRENDKVIIYVNPNKSTEVQYVPTLLSSSSLILLIFSILISLPLLAKLKSKIIKFKRVK